MSSYIPAALYLEPQNLRVQQVMSQQPTGSCSRCTRAYAFPAIIDQLHNFAMAEFLPKSSIAIDDLNKKTRIELL